jgi:hypothetical protein
MEKRVEVPSRILTRFPKARDQINSLWLSRSLIPGMKAKEQSRSKDKNRYGTTKKGSNRQ